MRSKGLCINSGSILDVCLFNMGLCNITGYNYSVTLWLHNDAEYWDHYNHIHIILPESCYTGTTITIL